MVVRPTHIRPAHLSEPSGADATPPVLEIFLESVELTGFTRRDASYRAAFATALESELSRHFADLSPAENAVADHIRLPDVSLAPDAPASQVAAAVAATLRRHFVTNPGTEGKER